MRRDSSRGRRVAPFGLERVVERAIRRLCLAPDLMTGLLIGNERNNICDLVVTARIAPLYFESGE
ncbi:hypothetical protein B6V73_19325 [Thioclava sp. JM3]|nr:hypothetical protein B6V73_19325 [Thioclava sp. JM3]